MSAADHLGQQFAALARTPGQPSQSLRVPLTSLVTDHSSMHEVLHSGRVSDTPHAPVMLNAREDGRGLEIADGHHRVAEAIRSGQSHVHAQVYPDIDEEPYEGPFYDFSKHA